MCKKPIIKNDLNLTININSYNKITSIIVNDKPNGKLSNSSLIKNNRCYYYNLINVNNKHQHLRRSFKKPQLKGKIIIYYNKQWRIV